MAAKIEDELDDFGRRMRALSDPIWECEKADYRYGDAFLAAAGLR